MARLKFNKPQHAMGPKGRSREMKPLAAGAHMPGKIGSHEGRGNSRGLPSGNRSSGGTMASHMPSAGRGGKGKIGGSDAHKGKPKGLPETMSSRDFERLGAD